MCDFSPVLGQLRDVIWVCFELAVRCDALDRIKQDVLPAIWVYSAPKNVSHLSFSTEWLGHQCDAGLIELAEYAGQLGVRLGLENRLHDIVGLRDHLAPGLGQVDWDLARCPPSGTVRSCECRSHNSLHGLAGWGVACGASASSTQCASGVLSCAARKYRTTRLILDNWDALAGWFG